MYVPTGVSARLLTFRARAADQAHAACTPGTAWPVNGHLPRLSREHSKDPRFRCHLKLTTLQRRRPAQPGALERLPGPHLTRSSRAVSLTLTTTVFSQRSSGRFDAYPRRSTPKGQRSSISRTAPLREVSYMNTSLCVRDAIEWLLPSPPEIHSRPRAVATSGVSSALSPLTWDSRPTARTIPQPHTRATRYFQHSKL